MAEQVLLSSGSFDGLREIGGFGQPLHALYSQIRAVLASELGPEVARLLAEPLVDRANNRIDWYAEGEPENRPVAVSELPAEQRQPILAQVDAALGRWRELAERYAASDDTRRAQLGAILQAALSAPTEADLFLVNGQPVMTGWGFAQDRSWEKPAGTEPPAAPLPVPPPLDVVVPEIAIPELKPGATTGDMPPAAASVIAAPLQTVASTAATLEASPGSTATPTVAGAKAQPDAMPLEPVAVSGQPLLPSPESVAETRSGVESQPAEPIVETPLEAESHPAQGAPGASSLESSPVTAFRYVVVGSRYFWGVCGLAVLLALVAAFLDWRRQPVGSSGSEAGAALSHAQEAETELRARRERLLTQLAERHGQCVTPTASGATPDSVTHPPQRDAALSAPGAAGGVQGDGREKMTTAQPGSSASAGASSPVPVQGAEAMRSAPETPASASVAPNGGNRAPAPGTASRTAPSAEALEQALEGEPKASGRSAPAGASSRQPSPETPVNKATPTPEERQEFANRMSAAGAATGEITVTLLWNNQSDLDLVVRCPSGRQLDYRQSNECGGALDVDANANRSNLSNRPVENVFWRAGKALPGTYEVAVRHAVRKDDENPRATPFQVRLSRAGQESVFKGVIMPNALLPVTTFTVER